MNHLQSARTAANSLDHDSRWQSWAARAEDMLGYVLGDQIEDAFNSFSEGSSVVEYVLDVKARRE